MCALCLGNVVCELHVETLCCLFMLHAWAVWSSSAGYFKWILWVVIVFSVTSIRLVVQSNFFQVCIFCMSKFTLLSPICFYVRVTHAAPVQSVKGTEPISDLPGLHCQHWRSNGQKLPFLIFRDNVIIFLSGLFPLSQFFPGLRFFVCETFFSLGIVGHIP